jgi:hypothetical protein
VERCLKYFHLSGVLLSVVSFMLFVSEQHTLAFTNWKYGGCNRAYVPESIHFLTCSLQRSLETNLTSINRPT